MPTPPDAAARDLLFGLFALQNGLIDQSKLVAAFHAWTLDKTRPMADVLVSQGALDAARRALIEPLVTLHLAKHGGDVEKSLAALDAGWSTRRKLQSVGDPDLDASLVHVGKSVPDDPDDPFITKFVSVGPSTSDGLRFRVLRPHARGGRIFGDDAERVQHDGATAITGADVAAQPLARGDGETLVDVLGDLVVAGTGRFGHRVIGDRCALAH